MEFQITTPCAVRAAYPQSLYDLPVKVWWITPRGENGNACVYPIEYGGSGLNLDTLQFYAGKAVFLNFSIFL